MDKLTRYTDDDVLDGGCSATCGVLWCRSDDVRALESTLSEAQQNAEYSAQSEAAAIEREVGLQAQLEAAQKENDRLRESLRLISEDPGGGFNSVDEAVRVLTREGGG